MAIPAAEAKKRGANVMSAIAAEVAPHGFRHRGLILRRGDADWEQLFELGVQTPNNLGDFGDALLQCYVTIRSARIGAVAKTLAGRTSLAGDDPSRLYRVPAGVVGPKHQAESWYPKGEDGWATTAQALTARVLHDVIPFFDAMKTFPAFAAAQRAGDRRIDFLDQTWVVKVAAGYVVEGDTAAAKSFLRTARVDAGTAKQLAKIQAAIDAK